MPELPPELSAKQQSLTDKQSAGQTEKTTQEAQMLKDVHTDQSDTETVESREVIDSNGVTTTTCIHKRDLGDCVQKQRGDGLTYDTRRTSDNSPCVTVDGRPVLTSTLPVGTSSLDS